MTNEEKANQISYNYGGTYNDYGKVINLHTKETDVNNAALEMAEWKDQQYQPLVKTCKDLISILQTSRAYHLGITGLDSHEEVEKKEREGNTALIRSIDREIKYANEIINELFKED